ncbi:MAG: class I SAM-dependent methyltransferase, partial [Janthinobacterium sp.]
TEAIWLADHLQNGSVNAVDIAEQMLSVFSRIPENLHPIAADMVYYQPDNRMDGIWARASIHHLTKAETVELFSTIKKYLKPNGIVFMINKYGSEEEIEEKKKYGQVIRRYFQYFNEERVELLAKDNEFSVEEQYFVQNDHKWLVSVLVNN